VSIRVRSARLERRVRPEGGCKKCHGRGSRGVILRIVGTPTNVGTSACPECGAVARVVRVVVIEEPLTEDQRRVLEHLQIGPVKHAPPQPHRGSPAPRWAM
jgi:hypothetical protein